MKKATKILPTCAAVLLAAALCFVPLFTNTATAHAAAGDTYTQNFTDAAAVNADFAAYYQLTMGAGSSRESVGERASDGTRLYLDGGMLVRQPVEGDISSSFTTDSFAILTLTKKQYVNFELTVQYKMGDGSDFWPVVAFRQQEAGKYFLETGAGVFTQKEGKVTLWGSDVDGIGGPYEYDVRDYDRAAWHTFRIRLDGLDLSVYLDGTSAMVRKLPASAFKSGYISLMSVNNDTRFRNLSVTELETKPIEEGLAQPPKPSADTPDSLDKMATVVPSIDELAGHTQGEKGGKSGCGASAYASIPAAALLSLAAALYICRRRKQRIK